MSSLPFKTRSQEFQTYLIDDGRGTTLEVPRYGSITVNEAMQFQSALTAVGKDASMAEFQIEVVRRFLALRLDLPLDDLELADAPWSFIDAAYAFFVQERGGWKDEEGETEGEGKRSSGKKSTGS